MVPQYTQEEGAIGSIITSFHGGVGPISYTVLPVKLRPLLLVKRFVGEPFIPSGAPRCHTCQMMKRGHRSGKIQ